MNRDAMIIRLVNSKHGSAWQSESAPSGMFRRVFAKLRSHRHGPDDIAMVAPFG
jgi:hypothetical protein